MHCNFVILKGEKRNQAVALKLFPKFVLTLPYTLLEQDFLFKEGVTSLV